MNALAKRPAAIVSPIAGTTRLSLQVSHYKKKTNFTFKIYCNNRDVVEVRMDLAGISCLVSDTAGLRNNTNDPIEQEGIKRAM